MVNLNLDYADDADYLDYYQIYCVNKIRTKEFSEVFIGKKLKYPKILRIRIIRVIQVQVLF